MGKPNPDDPYGNCGTGDMGACCAEMDLWEGNMMSTAFTAHPATNPGLHVCDGDSECGSQEGDRYIAPTDRDGCDMNEYQFHAPSGELEEIKQYYIQDGKKIG